MRRGGTRAPIFILTNGKMPIIIQNIDQYVVYYRNNNLIIEDKLLRPDEKKQLIATQLKEKA